MQETARGESGRERRGWWSGEGREREWNEVREGEEGGEGGGRGVEGGEGERGGREGQWRRERESAGEGE